MSHKHEELLNGRLPYTNTQMWWALATDAITQVERIADQMVRQNDLHEESLTLSREKLAVDKQVASGTEALERELLAQTANRATAKKPGRRDA